MWRHRGHARGGKNNKKQNLNMYIKICHQIHINNCGQWSTMYRKRQYIPIFTINIDDFFHKNGWKATYKHTRVGVGAELIGFRMGNRIRSAAVWKYSSSTDDHCLKGQGRGRRLLPYFCNRCSYSASPAGDTVHYCHTRLALTSIYIIRLAESVRLHTGSWTMTLMI